MRLYDPLEKQKKKRWWTPLFGLLLAIALAVVALAIAPLLREVWMRFTPQLFSVNTLVVQLTDELWWGVVDLGVAFFIWLVLFALGIALVLTSVGVDPAEKQAKAIMREAKRRKDAQRKKKYHR
ncbi:MAG: hypothetical protein M5R40_09250 [Anaerolineae bacterium]|nr:hypothetical protein [Anaerolineae bacterium]